MWILDVVEKQRGTEKLSLLRFSVQQASFLPIYKWVDVEAASAAASNPMQYFLRQADSSMYASAMAMPLVN
jgi:hypothetical protein